MSIHLKQFTKFPNAGDVASAYIVSRILGREITLAGEEQLDCPNLVAIGSILHWADRHSYVWGSGFITPTATLRQPPASIVAVRGHLTRDRLIQLGLPAPNIFGDPGLLISDVFQPTIKTKHEVGFIPHYMDMADPFVSEALAHGAVLIDPLSPLETYINALASCSVIVSSSLHGIVFAHSFAIPAVWISLSSKVIGDGFKFFDYYSSIGMTADAVPALSGIDSFEHVASSANLPRIEVDRSALRSALLGLADRLEASPS